MYVIAKITTQEKTQAQNLKANTRTQMFIDSGDEIDIGIAESIHALVSQVALYRGVSTARAKKIVSQLVKEVKAK